MIVSASRRTDIPAYYGEWFTRRLHAGYALVRNPFNPRQVRRVDLTPSAVDCFLFWNKNPAPFLESCLSSGITIIFNLRSILRPGSGTPSPPVLATAGWPDLWPGVIWRYDPSSDQPDNTGGPLPVCRPGLELAGSTYKVVFSFLSIPEMPAHPKTLTSGAGRRHAAGHSRPCRYCPYIQSDGRQLR